MRNLLSGFCSIPIVTNWPGVYTVVAKRKFLEAHYVSHETVSKGTKYLDL